MDVDEMRDADWEIVRTLIDKQDNAPNIAEETGYSSQYIRERLRFLTRRGVLEDRGNGLYAVRPGGMPDGEIPDDIEYRLGYTLEEALDGLIAAVNYADERDLDDIALQVAALYQELADKAPEEDWENTDSEEITEELGLQDGDPNDSE